VGVETNRSKLSAEPTAGRRDTCPPAAKGSELSPALSRLHGPNRDRESEPESGSGAWRDGTGMAQGDTSLASPWLKVGIKRAWLRELGGTCSPPGLAGLASRAVAERRYLSCRSTASGRRTGLAWRRATAAQNQIHLGGKGRVRGGCWTVARRAASCNLFRAFSSVFSLFFIRMDEKGIVVFLATRFLPD
jgi:hypothetical protein